MEKTVTEDTKDSIMVVWFFLIVCAIAALFLTAAFEADTIKTVYPDIQEPLLFVIIIALAGVIGIIGLLGFFILFVISDLIDKVVYRKRK